MATKQQAAEAVKRDKKGVRDEKGRFAPGNKTGGRKQMSQEIKDMLQAAAPDAVQLLIDTMQDETEKTGLRVRCAETILERVYGKNPQPIEGNVESTIRIVMEGDLEAYSA